MINISYSEIDKSKKLNYDNATEETIKNYVLQSADRNLKWLCPAGFDKLQEAILRYAMEAYSFPISDKMTFIEIANYIKDNYDLENEINQSVYSVLLYADMLTKEV